MSSLNLTVVATKSEAKVTDAKDEGQLQLMNQEL